MLRWPVEIHPSTGLGRQPNDDHTSVRTMVRRLQGSGPRGPHQGRGGEVRPQARMAHHPSDTPPPTQHPRRLRTLHPRDHTVSAAAVIATAALTVLLIEGSTRIFAKTTARRHQRRATAVTRNPAGPRHLGEIRIPLPDPHAQQPALGDVRLIDTYPTGDMTRRPRHAGAPSTDDELWADPNWPSATPTQEDTMVIGAVT